MMWTYYVIIPIERLIVMLTIPPNGKVPNLILSRGISSAAEGDFLSWYKLQPRRRICIE